MDFGVSLQALNTQDWERVVHEDFSRPPVVADADVWRDSLRLGDLAEPLGYDAIWTPEHHTSPYGMVPNPLLLLAYLAGRTTTIRLGTMVIVLPWHHPFRVAGEIAFTDVLTGGGRLQIGVGRGTAKREFDAHGIDRNESRGRFAEGIEAVRAALTQERFSFTGKYFHIPETSIRPRPISDDLAQNMLGAFVSHESLDVVAELGLGPLFNGGSPPHKVRDDIARFNALRVRRGLEPTQPVTFHWVCCTESEQEAHELAHRYMQNYNVDIGLHYGIADPESYKGLIEHDYYQQRTDRAASADPEQVIADLVESQIVGTPAQCIDKITHLQELTSARELIGLFQYGGMPVEVAERSMRLFGTEVLPSVHAMRAPLWPDAVGEVLL